MNNLTKKIVVFTIIYIVSYVSYSQIVVMPGYHAVQYRSQLPAVETKPVINIEETTATSGGNVTHQGGSEVTARGVVWSQAEDPTVDVNDGYTTDGTGIGTYVSNITELTDSTNYFIRAYATNSAGTAYGEQLSFLTVENLDGKPCPGTPTVTYGNYTYNTVQIGEQCWLAENLRTTKYNDGTSIDYHGTNHSAWTNTTSGAYAWYNNDESTYKILMERYIIGMPLIQINYVL